MSSLKSRSNFGDWYLRCRSERTIVERKCYNLQRFLHLLPKNWTPWFPFHTEKVRALSASRWGKFLSSKAVSKLKMILCILTIISSEKSPSSFQNVPGIRPLRDIVDVIFMRTFNAQICAAQLMNMSVVLFRGVWYHFTFIKHMENMIGLGET